jgi:hypothetical protein
MQNRHPGVGGSLQMGLVRQFLTENVLSTCRGVLGLVLGFAFKTGLELALTPFTYLGRRIS